MNEAIITALIGGLCVAIPSLYQSHKNNSKSQALLDYKLEQLTKQVEKHNKVVERTYELEENVRILTEKMKIYHHE